MEGDKKTDENRTDLSDNDLDDVQGGAESVSIRSFGTFSVRDRTSTTEIKDNKKGNAEITWKVEKGEK